MYIGVHQVQSYSSGPGGVRGKGEVAGRGGGRGICIGGWSQRDR